MSKVRSSLLFTLSIGSAAIAIYFWVEASELQSTITLAQEARDVAEFYNIDLQKKIQAVKVSNAQKKSGSARRRSSSYDEEGEKAAKHLLQTMKRLSEKEKEACRNVTHLVNELEAIRREIHKAYNERNKYKKKMSCLESCSS